MKEKLFKVVLLAGVVGFEPRHKLRYNKIVRKLTIVSLNSFVPSPFKTNSFVGALIRWFSPTNKNSILPSGWGSWIRTNE